MKMSFWVILAQNDDPLKAAEPEINILLKKVNI